MWISRRLYQLLPRPRSISSVHAIYNPRRAFILGIETSCDDTAVALLDASGKILGESIETQRSARFGGVIPSFAMGFHAESLPRVLDRVIEQATGVRGNGTDRLQDNGVEVIAVTTKPGLSGSLSVGSGFAKFLCRKNKLPMIPIHHMEAHALTARMQHEICFPFLVLLISGGHCLLALAESVNSYKLLGKQIDNSPGQVLDRIARRLKLHMLRPDLRDLSGGKAIETMGKDGDPHLFRFNIPMRNRRNCDFSFGGFGAHVNETIVKIEQEANLEPDALLPDLPGFCASIEYGVAKQLCERVQRGIEYLDTKSMWENVNGDKHKRSLVVSGGVASNQRIRDMLQKVCDAFNCRIVAPDPKYCTDNGVMIAWNGLEKHRLCSEVIPHEKVMDVPISPREPFGSDISVEVENAHIKCKWVKVQ